MASAIALGCATALALSACSLSEDDQSVIRSIIDKTVIESELKTLIAELEAIDGITAVEATKELTAEYDYRIQLTARSSEITGAQATAVLLPVCSVFGKALFMQQESFFELLGDRGSGLNLHGCGASDNELELEINYWLALQAAYGAPLVMGLGSATCCGREYARSIGAVNSGEVSNWDALRDVPDTSTAQLNWAFHGVWATGSLPSAEATELFESLRSTIPLIDYTTGVGMSLDTYGGGSDVSVAAAELRVGEPVKDSPELSAIVAGLKAATHAQSPLANVNITISSTPSTSEWFSYTLHFGDCDQDVQLHPGDVEFAEAVQGAGVGGVAAGHCPHLEP